MCISNVPSALNTLKTIIALNRNGAKQSISSVEAMLPETAFIRTHRSFIVSLQKITSFTAELIGIGKVERPVGKLFRNNVLKTLG